MSGPDRTGGSPEAAATIVDVLMTSAGLRPSAEELGLLAAAYPGLRDAVDGLYVPDTRDVTPVLLFDAAAESRAPDRP